MSKRLERLGFLTTCAACALAAPQAAFAQGDSSVQATSAAEADAATDMQASDEIVVTASRREERLRDAPSSITALTGASLETMGVQSFRDYASLVPGLSQRDSGAPGLGTVILRGLNTGAQQLTNTTAYYIDDAVFTASGFLSVGALVTPEPELAEIERVEVLKGPQGTLYGASSLGGLIRIVTRKPDATQLWGTARAEVSTLKGGDEGYMLRGTLNVPVIQDKLAVQVTGYHRKLGGFADNIATGTENVNDSSVWGGRIAIRATPTDNLTIDLSGVLQNIDNDGYALETLIPGTLEPKYGRYVYDHYDNFGSQVKYRIVNGTLTWDTDVGSLIASASYGQYKVDTKTDYTTGYLPIAVANAPAVLGLNIPANAGVYANPSPSMNKYTGDIRFVSKRLGRIEFMAGLFYTREHTIYDIDAILQDKTTLQNLPAPLDILYRTRTESRYKEFAGYGNLTFYLTDRLDIQGGIRYAHNKQDASTRGPNAIYGYVTGLPQVDFPFSDNSATYLATLRWRPTDKISTYIRAASGYRPGGPQTNSNPPPGAPLIINPDTVWNYEAGIKGSFLDGALSANLAVYHIDWKDIQLNTLDSSGVILQTNGGDANVDGFEAEVVIRPVRGMTIAANAGYTKARIASIDPGVSAVTGARAGDALPLTPDWTFAVAADHRIPLSDSMTALLGATFRYQSDMPNNYPNAAPLTQPKTLPSITTVDLRAGIDFGRYNVQLRAQNLFNQHRFLSIGTDYQATVIQPRSFTLSLSTNF